MSRRWRFVVFGVAVVAVLLFAFERVQRIHWVGSTNLEIEFLVTQADTGQPVQGAEIAVWSEGGFYRERADRQFSLLTDEQGKARRVCHESMCFGTQSGLRLTDTYVVHLPWWNFRVSAPGYWTRELTSLDIPENVRQVQRLGPETAKLVVRVSVERDGDGSPNQPLFPLRIEHHPDDWKVNQINEGLPYHWEKGIVHVLAWEVIEDDRPWQWTQILVLKKFDQPTENGGHRWVLAQLYRTPEDDKRPWQAPMRIPPPVLPGEKLPPLTDAQVFGHAFFHEPPTDEEVEAFLKETLWTPDLGTREAVFMSGSRALTTKLTAGGIDRTLWKRLFHRDVPTTLFPELIRGTVEKK